MSNYKFSIIVPIYNGEKYIKRCLDSVVNQTYKNYEIIAVNDGSTDESEKIIKSYREIKYIKQKNQGLSGARNSGIKMASGDYMLFLDADDSYEPDLLKNINNAINGEDIIRFQVNEITNGEIKPYSEKPFLKKIGPQAFAMICDYFFVELATPYAYKIKYWRDNNYSFRDGYYHEDFGLIPEVIFRANSVSSINYCGYNYFQNDNSIMSTTDFEKNKKKAYDALHLGLDAINKIKSLNVNEEEKAVFYSFIANSIFIKLDSLRGRENKKFIEIAKDNDLIKYLLDDTIKRKIKKIMYRIRYKL